MYLQDRRSAYSNPRLSASVVPERAARVPSDGAIKLNFARAEPQRAHARSALVHLDDGRAGHCHGRRHAIVIRERVCGPCHRAIGLDFARVIIERSNRGSVGLMNLNDTVTWAAN